MDLLDDTYLIKAIMSVGTLCIAAAYIEHLSPGKFTDSC